MLAPPLAAFGLSTHDLIFPNNNTSSNSDTADKALRINPPKTGKASADAPVVRSTMRQLAADGLANVEWTTGHEQLAIVYEGSYSAYAPFAYRQCVKSDGSIAYKVGTNDVVTTAPLVASKPMVSGDYSKIIIFMYTSTANPEFPVVMELLATFTDANGVDYVELAESGFSYKTLDAAKKEYRDVLKVWSSTNPADALVMLKVAEECTEPLDEDPTGARPESMPEKPSVSGAQRTTV